MLTHTAYARPAVYLTLAAAYQGAWKIQKCSKFCHLAEIELSKLLEGGLERPSDSGQSAAT